MIIISNNIKKLVAKKPHPIFKTKAISTIQNERPNKKIHSRIHTKLLKVIESRTKVSS